MPKLKTEPLTFEKVWAMFQETDRKFRENREQIKETDRILKEAAEQAKEADRKVWEQIKETNRIVGDLGNRFGDLAEHLVRPGIVEKFNTLGFHFNDTSKERKFRNPKTGKILAEVDILLENGDIVIAVEVKANLKNRDVDDHLKRMEVLRRIADSKGDKRKYLGAIAGAIIEDDARNYTLNAGFYLIVQSGDTMKLDMPKGFKPREW